MQVGALVRRARQGGGGGRGDVVGGGESLGDCLGDGPEGVYELLEQVATLPYPPAGLTAQDHFS
jgi:hypothetical protein